MCIIIKDGFEDLEWGQQHFFVSSGFNQSRDLFTSRRQNELCGSVEFLQISRKLEILAEISPLLISLR